LAEEINITRE